MAGSCTGSRISKSKKNTRPESKLLFIQRMRYIEQHRLQIDTT